jgi:predicted HTH domain antitoxin
MPLGRCSGNAIANVSTFCPNVASSAMKVTLDLPDCGLANLCASPAEFATELTLAACVKWYEVGRISQAKAAEIAGISRAAFIDALHAYRVAAIQLNPADLAKELAP